MAKKRKKQKMARFHSPLQQKLKNKNSKQDTLTGQNQFLFPQVFAHPKALPNATLQEPKPLIDIFQENNFITIIAEIAGFNKETVKIHVKDQKITLSANPKIEDTIKV